MDFVILLILCVFAWMFYCHACNRRNILYRILCSVFNINSKKVLAQTPNVAQEIKNEKKYTFGKYVSDVAETATMMITTKRAVPVDCVNGIFFCNGRTLQGISAICYVMTDGLVTNHRWKIYVDSAHKHIIGSIANEISNCYN